MERKTRISELTNRLLSNQFSEGGFVDESRRFGQSEDIQYQDDDDEDENEEYNSDSDQDIPKTRGISGITSNNTSRVLRNLRDGSKNLQTQREEYSKLKQRAIIPEQKEIQNINRRKLNGSSSSVSSSLSLSESLRSISQYSDQVARAQEAKKFSFEQFLDKVGTENWYQIRSLACFSLKWFVVGWFIISQSFLFQKVKFLSYPGVSQIETLCNDNLIDQSEAENFLLPNQFYSISVEFNLFCENEYLRQILNFSQSVFGILGYCFFGYLSDNHGRKHGLKLAWKIFTIGLIIFCSTQVLPLVMAGYCLSSFAALAVIIIEISLINEQSTGAVRVMSGIGLNIGFSFAQTIFTGFAYILHDWRILMFACGVIPAILLNLIFDNFEESPRYYYLKNKQKALRLLNRIALINGKRNLNIDLERSVWTEEWRDKSRRYKDLFQYLSLRICILAGSIIFFSTEMLFKAGEISLENNSLNTYQKVVLLSLSDVAASVTALFLINRMSRKQQLTISCSVSLVSIICFYGFTNIFNDYINDYTLVRIIQIAIAVVSRFSSNYLRTVAFVYFAELFPTIIRSMGMSVLFICSQLGSIIVYLMQLRNFSDALYIIPIIFCSTIAIVHIFWLPEIASAKQPICDEIAEIAFGYDDKFYLDETEDQ